MFTSAAPGADSVAAVAVSAAIAAIIASGGFYPKVMAGAEEAFAFSAGKNFLRFFLIAQAGRCIPSFFIRAVVANKVAVGNFFSAFAGNCDSVRDIVMAFAALFAGAVFLFQKGITSFMLIFFSSINYNIKGRLWQRKIHQKSHKKLPETPKKSHKVGTNLTIKPFLNIIGFTCKGGALC